MCLNSRNQNIKSRETSVRLKPRSNASPGRKPWVAEWNNSKGLQNLYRRFDSARRLQFIFPCATAARGTVDVQRRTTNA